MDNKSTNKKEAILKAAEKSFMSLGFAGTKTMAVAAEAGVTHAMLHYYFKTKKKLFDQVLVSKMSQMMDELASSFSSRDLPVKERIALGVERHFDLLAKSPDLPRFVVNEVINRAESLPLFLSCYTDLRESLEDTFFADMDEAVVKHEIRPIHPEQFFMSILSLNAFVFMMRPALTELLAQKGEDFDTFLTMRRRENVQMIMNRLNYD